MTRVGEPGADYLERRDRTCRGGTGPDHECLGCAALLPLVEEAGGRFTDWRGRRTIHGGEAVATNGLLPERVLGLLDEPGSR